MTRAARPPTSILDACAPAQVGAMNGDSGHIPGLAPSPRRASARTSIAPSPSPTGHAASAPRPARYRGRTASVIASLVAHVAVLVVLRAVTVPSAATSAPALDGLLAMSVMTARPTPDAEPAPPRITPRLADVPIDRRAAEPATADAPPPLAETWQPTDLDDLPDGGAEHLRPTIGVGRSSGRLASNDLSLQIPGAFRSRRPRGSPDGVAGGTGPAAAAPRAEIAAAPERAPEPPQVAPEVVRVPVTIVSAPEPDYPESARQSGVQGIVRLVVEVLEDGTVGDVEVVQSSGSRSLDDAAVRAARTWRFQPETADGVARRTRVRIPAIRFLLDGR